MEGKENVRIAIAGAGFSGIGMGIRLKQAGITDFRIFERADDLGGTWRDNTYPGAGCDVPTHLYSYSFARNPDWSHLFSDQEEILDYLRGCAEEWRIEDNVRYGSGLTGARWDEEAGRWEIETESGPVSAEVLVSCVGGLTEPSIPDFPGVERFKGESFHSARWNHDVDLTGKRVAVIGTGASAAQFIPEIQPDVAHMTVFQRTPPWVMPRPQHRFRRFERWLFRRFPPAQLGLRAAIYSIFESGGVGFFIDQRAQRMIQAAARWHLRSQVRDPALRRKLTPNYTIGCKRIVVASNYYPALQKPNVDVVTEGIQEITEHGVIATDGTEYDADVIVFGTGFKVMDLSMAEEMYGREGRSLARSWNGFPQAYLGTTVAGFPNFFMVVGPNTGGGNNSFLYMIESQLNYVMDALKTMERTGARAVEVKPERQDAFSAEMSRRSKDTVWTAGGCRSWYLDDQGRNPTLWPNFSFLYRWRTRRFDPADYVLEGS